MSEENKAAVTDPPPAPGTNNPPAAPAAPSYKFADPDGKLVTGWQKNLPEELQGEKCLETLPDVTTMAKNYVSTQKMRGKNSVVVPTDKSSQADRDAFYQALGRPKTVAEYGFERPDGLPEALWDNDLAAEITEKGWEAGLTRRQMDVLKEVYVGYEQRLATAVAAEKEATEKALRQEWGDKYDANVERAKAFLAKTTDEKSGQRERLLAKFGNDPDVIQWLSQWGEKTTEGRSIDTGNLKRTLDSSMARAAELQKTPGYITGELAKTDPAKFEAITREIREIYQKSYNS